MNFERLVSVERQQALGRYRFLAGDITIVTSDLYQHAEKGGHSIDQLCPLVEHLFAFAGQNTICLSVGVRLSRTRTRTRIDNTVFSIGFPDLSGFMVFVSSGRAGSLVFINMRLP